MGHIEEEEKILEKKIEMKKEKKETDCREWKLLVHSGTLCGMSESYGYQ